MARSIVEAKSRLIVALDVPSERRAIEMVDRLDGTCQWFKVGMELFYAEGRGVVDRLQERGFDVFLDLKLHDIPNTVAGTIRSLEELGVRMVTVHAGGGGAMMAAAQEAVRSSTLRLLAVTVLTSMDALELASVGVEGSPAAQVQRLGRLAVRAGISGLVCSAEETMALRQELGSEVLLVVPGIRPVGAAVGDQRRVASPAEALRKGASMLVVGRPITRAADPAQAAAAILAEMEGAFRGN